MRWVLAIAATGHLACYGALNIGDFVYDRDNNAETEGAGGSVIPSGNGVLVEANGQTFRIDPTEVTVEAYASWLESNPTVGQMSPCSFNHTFQPGEVSPGGDDSDCAGFDWATERAEHSKDPVRCVDWCDASAYCAAHEAELCGNVAGGNLVSHWDGANFVTDEPLMSHLYLACSNGGERTYPYANEYNDTACNGNTGLIEPVASRLTCVGGIAGLYDMSGNIEEWEASCDPPDAESATCMRRGGAFYTAQQDIARLACAGLLPEGRGSITGTTGFRCCSGP